MMRHDEMDNLYASSSSATRLTRLRSKSKTDNRHQALDDDDGLDSNHQSNIAFSLDRQEQMATTIRNQEDKLDMLATLIDELIAKIDKTITSPSAPTNQNAATEGNTPQRQSPSPSPTTSIKLNDLAKEYLRSINKFDGSGGTPRLFDYFDAVEQFITSANLSVQKKEVNAAISKITGNARMWLRRHVNTSGEFDSWDELKEAMTQKYAPMEQLLRMRDKLAIMKQKGLIEDYNDAFNRIMAQIEDMTDTEAIPQYLRGLSPRYRELILARENMPTTLEALQLACIRFDLDNKQRRDEAHATDRGGYRSGY